MIKKVCVITGSRAEYGLLKFLMQLIKDDEYLNLQIVVTGMHLSPDFGLTYREIEQDGFEINRKVEMLLGSDSSVAIAKSMGLGLIGMAEALNDIKPDLVLVLGDRYEIFAAVSAALVARIPVAHLHGGEITEGSFDDAFRHSITKMSHFHFVATQEYSKRVIQLGEMPNSVFIVGGLGVDSIKKTKLLSRHELEKLLGIKFARKNLLVTYHPVTLNPGSSENHMKNLLQALEELDETNLIITMPNSDNENKNLFRMIEQFVAKHSNAYMFNSLGQHKYFSCINQVDGVVGNSSSGLLEVPTFKKGTINIGSRQQGRLITKSIINCEPTYDSISNALKTLYSKKFQLDLKSTKNPYGEGGASEKIIAILKKIDTSNILKKHFFDLNFKCIKNK